MFLILQCNYKEIEVGLFNSGKKVESLAIEKTVATAQLIPSIDRLLKSHNLDLSKLEFIGANLGPAPFTTLRVMLTTINGISFAAEIPLVGVDGIKLFLKEMNNPNAVILLNAFAKDVYFAFWENGKIKSGYNNIDKFLEINKFQNPMFVGNGATLFEEKIYKIYPKATIEDHFSSLEFLAKECFEKFTACETTKKLLPIYLKAAL